MNKRVYKRDTSPKLYNELFKKLTLSKNLKI